MVGWYHREVKLTVYRSILPLPFLPIFQPGRGSLVAAESAGTGGSPSTSLQRGNPHWHSSWVAQVSTIPGGHIPGPRRILALCHSVTKATVNNHLRNQALSGLWDFLHATLFP